MSRADASGSGRGRSLPTVSGAESPGGRGLDLNRYRLTRFLLTHRAVRPTVQGAMVALFLLALYHAFAGPSDPGSNFAAVAFFDLWWAPVMLLSLLLVGRIWCYFCPIGAITQFVQRFGLQRRFPTFREGTLRVFGVGLSVLSIAGVSFLLARFPLYKLGVAHTPWLMGVYFLAFLAVAVGLALVFRQRAFCRYVCPATAVMSVTSRFSILELRQDRESRVPDCMTAEFKSNYLSTERRCVACMHCAEGQPGMPVRLRLRWPGAAAVRQRILLPDEALVALVIWAVFPLDHVLGGGLSERLAGTAAMPMWAAQVVAYVVSVVGVIAAVGLASRLGARWAGLDPGRVFLRFAFAYAPLGIGFQLSRHTFTGLLEDGGGMVNTFAAGLGVPLGLPEAWASAETLAFWQNFAIPAGLVLALVWAWAVAWFVARDMAGSRAHVWRAFAPHAALMAASTVLILGV